MTTRSSVMRRGVLRWLALGGLLLSARPAAAELVLFEGDGWSFFTDGRINSFVSTGYGDGFPNPTPNNNPQLIDPATGMPYPNPEHSVVGGDGSLFNAGFQSDQNANGKYNATRVRSGFLGSIIAFGMKRQLTETVTIKSYVSLWGTAQSDSRQRTSDSGAGALPTGKKTSKGFDVRDGWMAIEGPFGVFVAGRQGGMLGGISTEIDFLYGHNFGLGLPCVETYFPTCGHIGTGALGPGNGPGFTYMTPSLGGLRLKAGLYDPVRMLGAWERVPYPRPEGAVSFERRTSDDFMFKLQAEGMYQYMAQLTFMADPTSMLPPPDKAWGVAGGGRLEWKALRLGLSGFRGKGLGAYLPLQNAPSTFEPSSRQLRYFTGIYAQLALVFGHEQLSAGAGQVIADQLEADKVDEGKSNLKRQAGVSAAFYHRVSDNLVLGIDYFLFHTDWWGAPNSTSIVDPNNPDNRIPMILPGYLKAEKQTVHFVNMGATFLW